MNSSIKHSGVYVDFKKSAFKWIKEEEKYFESFQKELASSLSDIDYVILNFVETQRYKFELIHNMNVGFEENDYFASTKVNLEEFKSNLISVLHGESDQILWLFSTYNNYVPSVMLSCKNYISHFEQLSLLLEEQYFLYLHSCNKFILVNSEAENIMYDFK